MDLGAGLRHHERPRLCQVLGQDTGGENAIYRVRTKRVRVSDQARLHFNVNFFDCRVRAIHEEWYWDLMAAGAGVPDPIEHATSMPKDCPRVLKTHLSVDMLPDQIMQKRNKVTTT